MKNLKKYNWYKIGFLSVCGAVFILTLYLAAYGAVNRSHAFAQWMNGGMSAKDAQCAMFASEHFDVEGK